MPAESQVKAKVLFDISELKEGVAYTIEDLRKMAGEAEITAEKMKTKSQAMADAAREAAKTMSAGDLLVAEKTKELTAAKAELTAAMRDVRNGAGSEDDALTLLADKQRKVREATEGLAVAQRSLKESMEAGSISGIAESVRGFSEVFLLMEGFNKIKEATASSMEFGESLVQASAKTGLTVETLSTLRYAASVTGHDFDSLSSAVAKMDKAIGAAAGGDKKANGYLSALGLNASELEHRSDGAEVAFRRLAEVMSHTEGLEKQNLAFGLLGKMGADQIDMLVRLGTGWDEFTDGAKASGTYLSTQQAQILEEQNRKFREMEQHIRGAEIALTQGLVPALLHLANVAADGEKGLSFFGELGNVAGRALAGVTSAVYGLLSGLSKLAELEVNVAHGFRSSEQGDFLHDLAAEYDRQSKEAMKIAVHGAKAEEVKPEAPTKPGSGFDPPDLHAGEEAKKAAEQKLKAMEAHVAEWKTLTNVTAKALFDYWETQKSAFSKGSDEYNKILEKQAQLATQGAEKVHEAITKIKSEKAKDSEEAAKVNESLASSKTSEMQKQAAEDFLRMGPRWDEYWRSVAKGAEINARLTATMQEQIVRVQEEAGVISPLAAAQRLAALHAREHLEELRALEAQLASLQNTARKNPVSGGDDPKQAKEIQDLKNQIAQMKGDGLKQAGVDQAQMTQLMAKPYLTAFNSINSGWLKVQNDLLAGNRRIGRDFREMALTLAQDGARAAEEMLANFLRSEIRQVAAHRLANLQKTESDAQSAAVGDAIHRQSSFKEIFIDAKSAAASAFKATAGIPIVGPVLAPIAAGAAFAGVMSLAAFEVGTMEVPRAGIAMLHPGEAVLGSPGAQAMRDAFSGKLGGGGITNHFNMGGQTFHGARGIQDFRSQFRSEVKRTFRGMDGVPGSRSLLKGN